MSRLNSRSSWILLSALTAGVYQLSLMAILSRMLPVAEIGLYSLLLVFSALAAVIQDGGLANYIVHRQKLSRAEYSAIFLLSITLGLIVAALLLVISPWLALWYQQDHVPALMPIIASTIVVNSCITPYQASMLVSARQIALAKTDIISRMVAVIVAILLLLLTPIGLASVLIAGLCAAILRLLLLVVITPKAQQPCAKINFSIVPLALRFGAYQTGALLLNQLRTRLDQIIIGKLMGMEVLAIYSLAKELISQPTKFITPLIQNLLFPRLAQYQHKPEQQQQIFCYALKAIGWSNLAIYSVLALLAGPIVSFLYGSSYYASAIVVSLLSTYGMVRTLGAPYVSVAQAHGRSDLEFYWNIFAGVIMGAAVWFSAKSGSIALTAAMLTIVQVVLTYFGFYYFSRSFSTLKSVTYIQLTQYPVLIMLVISAIAGWIYI